MYHLIIDSRERAIAPHFGEEYPFDMTVSTEQIAIGDYAVYEGDSLKFIIERKTWADLGASIRDGRKDNYKKMLRLRDETGCRVLYLIEGSRMRYTERREFGGIAFKSLRAHLDRLMFNHGIHIIYAESPKDCADRIIELIRNTGGRALPVSAAEDDTPTLAGYATLTTPIARTDQQIIVDVWRQIPMISDNNVHHFLQWRLGDFLLGHVPAATVADLRYPGGRRLGDAAAAKITRAVRSTKAQARMVAALPGISRATAKKIVDAVPLAIIAGRGTTPEEMQSAGVPKHNVAAEALNKFFRGHAAP